MALAEQSLSHTAPPICSVCIANYNGLDIISECIESVLNQECGFPVEIIVHDDASSDGSAELIRTRFPQVRLIESKDNVGFCVSNNRMSSAARGKYLLLLNNDAALMPGALRALIKAASSSAPSILTLAQYDWETGMLVDRGCLLDPFYNPVPNYDLLRQEVAMVIGACLWIPHETWQELGGFPEWFESIAEDMYLCCKARLFGYRVKVVPGSGYRHRQGKSFGGNRADSGKLASTFRRRRLSERNKTFVMLTCTPATPLTFLLPLHLMMLTLEGIVLSVLRGNIHIWREIYANVFFSISDQLHRLLSCRKRNLTLRKISTASYLSCFVAIPQKALMLVRFGIPHIR